MVDLPCLTSQTFWCMAVPNDAIKREIQPTIEEVILAEKSEQAKSHIEEFWNASCAVVLSQDDVAALLQNLKSATVENLGDKAIPEPSIFDKLFGVRPSERDKKERFFVSGTTENGKTESLIVAAKTTPAAYLASTAEKIGFTPTSAYSESQLTRLLSTMEMARLGKLNVARVSGIKDPMERLRERSRALGRML